MIVQPQKRMAGSLSESYGEPLDHGMIWPIEGLQPVYQFVPSLNSDQGLGIPLPSSHTAMTLFKSI